MGAVLELTPLGEHVPFDAGGIRRHEVESGTSGAGTCQDKPCRGFCEGEIDRRAEDALRTLGERSFRPEEDHDAEEQTASLREGSRFVWGRRRVHGTSISPPRDGAPGGVGDAEAPRRNAVFRPRSPG